MSICSEDLRQRVRKYVGSGGSISEAAKIYGVSRKSVYNWLSNTDLALKSGRKLPLKVNNDAVVAHVNKYPDMILRERAAVFNLSINGMWVALCRLGFRKKNDALQGKKLYTQD